MPSSIQGNSRASSARDTCRQFRPPTSAVQARSNSTTSGTAKDKGMNCARMGTATMAAPNPVMPNTTYAVKTTGAARAMRSAGMSRSAYMKVKGNDARQPSGRRAAFQFAVICFFRTSACQRADSCTISSLSGPGGLTAADMPCSSK